MVPSNQSPTSQSRSLRLLGAGLLVLVVGGYPIIAVVVETLALESRVLSIAFRALVVAFAVVAILFSLATRRFPKPRGAVFLVLGFWTIYGIRLALDVWVIERDLRLESSEYVLFAVGTALVPLLGALAIPANCWLDRRVPLVLTLFLLAGCVGNLILGFMALQSGDYLQIGRAHV